MHFEHCSKMHLEIDFGLEFRLLHALNLELLCKHLLQFAKSQHVILNRFDLLETNEYYPLCYIRLNTYAFLYYNIEAKTSHASPLIKRLANDGASSCGLGQLMYILLGIYTLISF